MMDQLASMKILVEISTKIGTISMKTEVVELMQTEVVGSMKIEAVGSMKIGEVISMKEEMRVSMKTEGRASQAVGVVDLMRTDMASMIMKEEISILTEETMKKCQDSISMVMTVLLQIDSVLEDLRNQIRAGKHLNRTETWDLMEMGIEEIVVEE